MTTAPPPSATTATAPAEAVPAASPAPGAHVRRLAFGGIAGALAAVVLIGALDVWTARWPRNPLWRTISEYALGPLRPVFDVGVALLSLGSAAVLVALLWRGLAKPWSGGLIALGLWSAGLAMVVVFPKHDWAVGPSWNGYLHQFGSLMAFIALPIAAIKLGRAWRGHAEWQAQARWSQRLGWLSYGWFAILPASLVYARFSPLAWWEVVPLGLVERLLTLTEVVAVLLLAVWVLRADRGTVMRAHTRRRT